MITVEMVYGLALARYGVVSAPQLAAVYESLPDADRQVAERVEAMPMPAAMVAARTLLADAETRMGTGPQDVLRVNAYDPRCGVGLFLVAIASELARCYARRLTGKSGGRRTDRVANKVLPDIILSCVYGMDTDPLAVGLARLALSLQTDGRLAPQALEQHIVVGDYTTGAVPPAKPERARHLIGLLSLAQ